MLLSAFLLVAIALGLCAAGTRATLTMLNLNAMQVLLYLGIANVPAPPVSRRRRA